MKKTILTILCLFVVIPAYARTITINADGSSEYPTIQAAIDAANDGDVIILKPGRYTGTGNRDIDYLGKAITVRSTDPNDPNIVASTIIDCNGTEADPHRGFHFHSEEILDSVLDGLTITGGYSPTVLENVYLSNGGAIRCKNASPTIKNCVISGNIAGSAPYNNSGGGICIRDGNPVISDCIFFNNTAKDHGGAMFILGGMPEITNCEFISNRAEIQSGGASFSGWSPYSGVQGRPNFKNCLFFDNSANYGGGAVRHYSYRTLTLTNCTVVANISLTGGGGISIGKESQVAPTTVTNCILWDNISEGIKDQAAQLYGGNPKVNYCNIENWTGNLGGSGNIGFDPCFVDADSNDYRLLEYSPCINAGDPNHPYDPNETDLDSNPRIIDGRIDMGAYESNLNTAPVAVAGPNQTSYAWIDGIADVNLDGSGSYDDDGDELTYYWSWEIEPNIYEANGVNPTIELPVGEHIIELVVNDGLDDSEPNCTTVTVIEPLNSFLRIMPRTINRKSRQRHIMAWLSLPAEVTRDDIDENVPLTLYPGDIEASRQFIFENNRYDNPGAFILAFFKKRDFMNAIPDNGQVQLEAVGQLNTGRYFFGQRTIRIINPPHRRGRSPSRR